MKKHENFVTADGEEFIMADGESFKVEVEVQKDKSGKLSVKNISRKLSSSEKLSATEQKELKKELTRYFYIGDSPASNLCMGMFLELVKM